MAIREKMQVPNWTGPGVRRSKRLLFAICTLCKLSRKTYRNSVIRPNLVIRSSSVLTRSRFSEMKGAIAYGHDQELGLNKALEELNKGFTIG